MTGSAVAERRFNRWLTTSDPSEQTAAGVLASTLVTPPAAFADALSAVLGTDEAAVVDRVSENLLSRPFVEQLADGFRIAEPMASIVRAWFHETNPDAYAAVNELMLSSEVSHFEAAGDLEERWFARVRVAFYLAALDPSEAAQSFIDAFADPPSGDPGPPRSWLAELVMKQRGRLAEETRALQFFQGFQAYKDGRFREASRHFEAVLDSEEQDPYRAITLHLWSLLNDRHPRSEEYLREAVELSADLGLDENEVMARNTLVFRLLGLGLTTVEQRSAATMEAAVLADTNLARAETTGDPYLMVWCLTAKARTQWTRLTDHRRFPGQATVAEAEQLIDDLTEARRLAFTINDFQSVIEAVNESAQIMRDRGEYERAVIVLEDSFENLKRIDAPLNARRWAQTAGSIARQRLDEHVRVRLLALREGLDAWLAAS